MAAEPSTGLRIERIGLDGDGVARTEAGAVYVPLTLPGETVRATGDGQVDILVRSAERVRPPCPHFGPCGGCTLQHWNETGYATWKSGLLRHALDRLDAGNVALAPLHRTPPGARRRMEWAVRRSGSQILLGLHTRRSDAIVDMRVCPVLDPVLAALLDPLRDLLRRLAALRTSGNVLANLVETGPDLTLRTDAALTTADRTLLAAFARTHNVPRISWARGHAMPETAAQLHPSIVRFAGVPVDIPAAAFLQASPQGEAATVAAVLRGLPERSRLRVSELYAGCGTLTLPLATRATVTAYEGDAAAHAALRRAGAGRPIAAMHRDLVRQPVTARELASSDAVVLDPPFAGAGAQIEQIAGSTIQTVVMVSCNPVALLRDGTALRDAGFTVTGATPIDQFTWSSRLESVVTFSRPRARRSVRQG